MAAVKKRCKGTSRRTGEPCKNRAFKGSDYCQFHGAQALGNKGGAKKGTPKPPGAGGPPPKGSTNALKHGAYSTRLPPDEQPIYEAYLEEYLDDVPNPSVTDRRALERLAILETKWHVAVTIGATAHSLDLLHRLLPRELKALQVTRESKDTARTTGATPAEVMGALLARVRERGMLPAPPPEEAEVINVEVVEVEPDDTQKEG